MRRFAVPEHGSAGLRGAGVTAKFGSHPVRGKTKSDESVGTPDAFVASEGPLYARGMARRTARPFVLAFAVAAPSLVHCTSFEDAPASPTVDGGGDDATRADASGDGGASQADGASRPCAPPDCEGFDRVGWENDWSIAPTGSMKADDGDAFSPPASLHVVLAAGGGARSIARSFPESVRTITVEVWAKVDKRGDGEVDFLGFRSGSLAAWLTHTSSGNKFVFQTSITDADAKDITDVTGVITSGWTQARVTIDRDVPQITWSIAGNNPSIHLADQFKKGTLTLHVGAPYARDVTSAWDVRFDDVRILAK